jgi:hypothetical protein
VILSVVELLNNWKFTLKNSKLNYSHEVPSLPSTLTLSGYRTDPTEIAQAAIASAKQQEKDVVLIDTAGRMQDNQILMEGLSTVLFYTRKIFLIFFISWFIQSNLIC